MHYQLASGPYHRLSKSSYECWKVRTEQRFKSSLFRRKLDKVLEITASIFKRKLLPKLKI